MADEVRLIDAELLTTNIAQIAKACAKSDKQKALIGRILFMIENMPTVEAEPVNDWISVKDRLPDECQEVLIYCPEFLEEIRKAFYTEGDFYDDNIEPLRTLTYAVKGKLPSSDEVMWAIAHKLCCNIVSMPQKLKDKSRKWLEEHGYKAEIW